MKTRHGFTLIELLVVIVIIGILVAIALPNFIKIKDKAKEAEVKQNLHAVQLAIERYAVDSQGSIYPMILMGGDWTDTYVVWQKWVDDQELLDPDQITNPNRRDRWRAADTDVGDSLVMEAYLPSYPGNPFISRKSDTLLPEIFHNPSLFTGLSDIVARVVGGRQSDKMFEVFGPNWVTQNPSIAGDSYVHHIFNNPKYDTVGDAFKNPVGGWASASGNTVLTGSFSYWPRQGSERENIAAFPIMSSGNPMGYTLAAYGSVRTKGQDVYNRNGNYKGRWRTETCDTDCPGGGIFPNDIPCLCGSGDPPTRLANNGGSDTILDGVVITLDSGVDKKSSRVNTDFTEGG
ncbi:type II secretion system protein [bacterium]|nr:type II secretion system protein [bacterium]